MTTIQSLVVKAFSRYRERTCLAWEGGGASYAETERRVRGLAALMQRRTPLSGHVGILLPNGREYAETILGCALSGRVRVPIGEREPAAIVAKKIVGGDCSLVVTTEAWYETLRAELGDALPAVLVVDSSAAGLDTYESAVGEVPAGFELDVADWSDRYRLSYTGGTTGDAKAVVQTHRQELALTRNLLLEAFQPGLGRAFVAATPMSHASGSFVLANFIGGGRLAWTVGFDADRLVDNRWLGGEVGLQTFVVPTALEDLATAAAATQGHALDTVIYGGAPCAQPVLEHAVATIGQRLVQIYGQAEAPMTICVLPADDHDDPAAIAGCSGYPFMYVNVTLERGGRAVTDPDETGEVVVRADHVMEGYWRAEAASAERFTPDGGLMTQDLGRWDEHGRLWIVGRTREMFISGGYNVFPAEVERRLGGIAGAQALAVFAVPHPRWGEATVIAIVPSEQGTDEERLRAAVEQASRERLAAYERPKHVVLVDELPLTSVGKVSRNALAESFQALFTTAG